MAYKYDIGVIGCGKMGGAILSAIIKTKKYKPEKIIASAGTKEEVKDAKKNFPEITVTEDNVKLAKASRIILLAVKPGIVPIVGEQIRECVSADQIIISIAAGVTIRTIENTVTSIKIAGRQKVVRVMPNMCALVFEAMSGICDNGRLADDELNEVLDIFERIGKAKRVPESQLDIVTGLSGSSPAFVFQFIESMADAGVAEGMTRNDAYLFSAQAVLGAAKLVLESGRHPGALKDDICSPGGTTIEGVHALEDGAFRATVINAIRTTIEKSRSLNEK